MRTVKKNTMRNRLTHRLHPRHIYCRVAERTNSHKLARRQCMRYERYMWRWMKKIIELLPK